MKYALPLVLALVFVSGCTQTGYVTNQENATANVTNNTENIIEDAVSTIPEDGSLAVRSRQCPECDDSDPCTLDTCSSATNYECNHTEIKPCCGNSVCENNENCLEDCPPVIDVSITDIHYESPEWVELRNSGDDVNLSEWTLEDASGHKYTFWDFILPSGKSVKINTEIGTDTKTELYWGYRINIWNDNGDNATLRDAEQHIIDQYFYLPETTTSTATTTSIATTTSAETTSTTTVETTTAETTTTTTSSTTTAESSSTTTTSTIESTTTIVTTTTIIYQLLISEVYYDTIGDDSKEEWIELYNPTQNAINLDGYNLSNNYKDWRLPNVTIASLAYISIARNGTGFFNLYSCNPDIDNMTLTLANNGDNLTLKNADQEIDFVAWGGSRGWNIHADTNMSIVRNNTDTDSADDWLNNTVPTPVCGA